MAASARWSKKSYPPLLIISLGILGVAGLLPFIISWFILNSPAPFDSSDNVAYRLSSTYFAPNETDTGMTASNKNDVQHQLQLRAIQNRTIMLVHVGKAGGSTFLQSFYQKHWQPGNVLQRTPVLLPICHMHACHNATLFKATTLLFVVRNPVDRFISAYKFSHPDNCITFDERRGRNVTNDIWGCNLPLGARDFYRQCAPTLEALANDPFEEEASSNSSNPRLLSVCRQSIRGMVAGQDERYRKHSTHAYFNYKHYKHVTMDRHEAAISEGNTTNTTIEIFVVRTEHLWSDASSLDVLLNGTGNFDTKQRNVTHGSENYHKPTSTVSKRGYERLCCMLRDEIGVFGEIIARAENLSGGDKVATMREVERRCGILQFASRAAWAVSCQDGLVDAVELG